MCKVLWLLLCVSISVGCRPAPDAAPVIDQAQGLELARRVTLVVQSAEGAIGCATIVAVEPERVYLLTASELLFGGPIELVAWDEIVAGQKYDRQLLPSPEIVATEPRLRIALLSVPRTINRQPLKLASAQSLAKLSPGSHGYGARVAQPHPFEALPVKFMRHTTARGTTDSAPAEFLLAAAGPGMRGSPLVTDQGELAAIAVSHFYDGMLYSQSPHLQAFLAEQGVVRFRRS